MKPMDRVRHYVDKARECRELADKAADTIEKNILLKLAADYEWLAVETADLLLVSVTPPDSEEG